MEAEMQEPYDPSNDPEEQKLIISVLDSFRYTYVPHQHKPKAKVLI